MLNISKIVVLNYIFFFLFLGVCLGMAGRGGPYFLSKPNTYRKQVGGTVTLSCHVDNLGKFFFIKNKDNKMLEIFRKTGT